ncbi:MAG: HAD family phosphatase [Ktedonobacteraceae bacterium]|nr:HAD family phosphatase [Ktedonobacteraceae bacterium]
MATRAIVFDIGGVLEITPDTGMTEKWEARLALNAGELDERMCSVWNDGALGRCSEEDVRRSLGEILGIDQAQIDAFMNDLWEEYLGTLNVEMAAYFSSLRPRYQTAIISNSFVGARDREQQRYHFDEMADVIIYSHEVGIAKPERRIFELACERLGVQPVEMIFLDDAERNIVAARELGIHAILFRGTNQAIADIQACLRAATS